MNADVNGDAKAEGTQEVATKVSEWICSLTHDKLEQPCLLSLTGRTYSMVLNQFKTH